MKEAGASTAARAAQGAAIGGSAANQPQRNQLVWIDAPGWRGLQDGDWDDAARSLLAHWSARQLPLVVACDRASGAGDLCDTTPSFSPGPRGGEARRGLASERAAQLSARSAYRLAPLSLGLPAPLRWARRRLALRVEPARVQALGAFPTLTQVAIALGWNAAASELADELAAVGALARVYGSHGWQVLSGEPCVGPQSDIDLRIEVDDVPMARAALPLLQRARLPRRLDGEFAFPDGEALAWREFEGACAGRAGRVLLKRRSGARLVEFAAWASLAAVA